MYLHTQKSNVYTYSSLYIMNTFFIVGHIGCMQSHCLDMYDTYILKLGQIWFQKAAPKPLDET